MSQTTTLDDPELLSQGQRSARHEDAMMQDLLGDAPEWQEYGLCGQADPEAFFPGKGESPREAKRVCRRCLVKDQCLEYALAHDERFGIWGGMTERERRKIKRRAM